MSDYAPETGAVRISYGWTGHDNYIETNRQAKEAEFDRWLAAHDQQVRKKFADELTRKGIYSFNIHQIRQYASE